MNTKKENNLRKLKGSILKGLIGGSGGMQNQWFQSVSVS